MQVTALREVQTLLGGEKFPNCESPSLRLEKFVRLGDNTKREEIEAVVSCQKKYGMEIPRFLPKGAVSFIAKLESRLIVNQAGGILENAGLCLHPHFGAPYIPGSAVKGIARHAAWCEWKEEEDETKKKDIAIRIAETFGYPTGDTELDAYLATPELGWKDKRASGSVVFLSAIPDGKGQLVTDIVNCHHPDYYAGKKSRAMDDESPNPQFFPTVESDSRFLFTLVQCTT
ncbi:MAG: type III-B CRISPR module RAMP protein Cmr6 [Kiritimatiellae bacterium]|nr:type III-B CRISPR module RAMP protein Cmr6 [Kiritimatiellia bacterium]